MENPYQHPPQDQEKPERRKTETPGKVPLSFYIVGLIILTLFVRITYSGHLEKTSLLYVGLPSLLAIILSLSPQSGSPLGGILKATTYLLLFAAIALGEGVICILMAAPIFYGVALIVGVIANLFVKEKKQSPIVKCSMLGAVFLSSLEGVSEALSFDRAETVKVTRFVPLDLITARQALAEGPDFTSRRLPVFLALGFPTPQAISGFGLNQDAEWEVSFNGKSERFDPLRVRVVESREKRIRFRIIQDETEIGQWMRWREVTWDFEEKTNGTEVVMTVSYERLLDPAWYFKPLERFGVTQAADHFMEVIFADAD